MVLGNTLLRWVIAVALVVGLTALVRLVQRRLAPRLAARAERTGGLLDLSLANLLAHTNLLSVLAFKITTLLASLGLGGIALALAVQNILGDLFASLSIALDKPFVIGDFIKVDEHLGTVQFIGLKTTRIRSLAGEQIVFANGDLLKSRIQNWTRTTTSTWTSSRRSTWASWRIFATTASPFPSRSISRSWFPALGNHVSICTPQGWCRCTLLVAFANGK
jgi:small-conductance mechanosensitive channel